jgi:hypothetical protein
MLLLNVNRGSVKSKALGKRTFYQQVRNDKRLLLLPYLILKQQHLPLAEAYTFSTSVMADAAVSPAAQEGIQAFLQKRTADFGGK